MHTSTLRTSDQSLLWSTDISSSCVRFQVLTAASMKSIAFLDIMPCSLVGVDRRFRCACFIISLLCWGQYTPLKRQSTPTRLHGAISQKLLIFTSPSCSYVISYYAFITVLAPFRLNIIKGSVQTYLLSRTMRSQNAEFLSRILSPCTRRACSTQTRRVTMIDDQTKQAMITSLT
jgi:hypothetical protein